MKNLKKLNFIFILLFTLITCAGCLFGGGSGSSNNSVSLSQIELADPTPGTADGFGDTVVILDNGNIVVTDPYDETTLDNAGAVHLYSPNSSNPIASFYGTHPFDLLGISGITALPNSNFLIISEDDDVEDGVGGLISDAGSIQLVDGATGNTIGAPIVGGIGDKLGTDGVIALSNNNYVVIDASHDVIDGLGGILGYAGSVQLVDGNTGLPIGNSIVGDKEMEFLGLRGVAALSNSNYVIVSPRADVDNDIGGQLIEGGIVQLVDGYTGLPIGDPIVGEMNFDSLGSGGIAVLSNNNFVIASPEADIDNGSFGLLGDAGSVILVNGSTGLAVGVPIVGEMNFDSLGLGGITALGNNNFVIASPDYDIGDNAGGTLTNAGSVQLVDGNTGIPIGVAITGENEFDEVGVSGGVTVLANSNYVILDSAEVINDGMGGVVSVLGSVVLVDGSSGLLIGSPIAGEDAEDFFGSLTLALQNNNFVIVSPNDTNKEDVSAPIMRAGSVKLVDGSSGLLIGVPVVGDQENDALGSTSAVALNDNKFVVISELDDANGIFDSGSVRVISGEDGVEIASILGATSNDIGDGQAISGESFYIISLPFYDQNGLTDSGRVELFPY